MLYVEDVPYGGLEYRPCHQLSRDSGGAIPDEFSFVRPKTIQYWPKEEAIEAWVSVPIPLCSVSSRFLRRISHLFDDMNR